MSNKLSKKESVLQAVKFALFSASAGVIQIVSFTLLNELLPNVQTDNPIGNWFFNSEYGACYLVALILSVLWNFTFNRKFTFKSANNIPVAMAKVFGFYCVFTPVSTILGEYVVGHSQWEYMEYVVLAVTMATNMITEFLYSKYFVYKDDGKTARKEKN